MPDVDVDGDLAVLIDFRAAMAGSIRCWSDTLIETVDALACSGRPVLSPAWLTLEPELRRGYGSLYQALETANAVDAGALRDALVAASVSRGGPLWFAVDVTPCQRPEAEVSPERGMVYTGGNGDGVAAPGWPVLVTAHVGDRRSSSVIGVDAQLLGPEQNTNAAAAQQIRAVAASVRAAGGDGAQEVPLFVLDSGFCPIYLTQQVADTAQILVRLRTDRVFHGRAEPKPPNRTGPQAKHGPRFKLNDPATHHDPDEQMSYTVAASDGGQVSVEARFWRRMHPAPRQRRKWDSDTPIEGTLCHRVVTWPCGRTQEWWLWWAGPAGTFDSDVMAGAYQYRFSIEHMFKSWKQLGWLSYCPIEPAAAVNWTQIMMSAYAQLVLAAPLAQNYRLPWDQPGPPTPARVQRVFRRTRPHLPPLTSAPKSTRPGPGRPPGRPNQHRRPKQPVTRKGRKPNTGHPKGHQHRLAPEYETAGP